MTSATSCTEIEGTLTWIWSYSLEWYRRCVFHNLIEGCAILTRELIFHSKDHATMRNRRKRKSSKWLSLSKGLYSIWFSNLVTKSSCIVILPTNWRAHWEAWDNTMNRNTLHIALICASLFSNNKDRDWLCEPSQFNWYYYLMGSIRHKLAFEVYMT